MPPINANATYKIKMRCFTKVLTAAMAGRVVVGPLIRNARAINLMTIRDALIDSLRNRFQKEISSLHPHDAEASAWSLHSWMAMAEDTLG